MTGVARAHLPAARLTPGIGVADPHAAHWVARVILTLRREVCWCWRVRDPEKTRMAEPLPPAVDAASENLDLVRYEDEKARFFETDPTARYLSEQIVRIPVPSSEGARRGTWAWLVQRLELDGAAQFLLGLVLAARLDAGVGPVLATCFNDRTRPFPTLALAQRLWPDPLAIVACADAAHPLFRSGLLFVGEPGADLGWLAPLDIHAPVARHLADPHGPTPRGLHVLKRTESRSLDAPGRLLVERLRARDPEEMEIVSMVGAPGTDFETWASSIAGLSGRTVAAVNTAATAESSLFAGLAVVAWLRDIDLVLPELWVERFGEKGGSKLLAALEAVPVRWYVPVQSRESLAALPQTALTPPLTIPPLGFEERAARFRQGFGDVDGELAATIDECSRRFRFQETTIDRVVHTFRSGGRRPDLHSMIVACRNEAATAMGGLAQLVAPRFDADELVLPKKQRQQFDDVLAGMRALTEVHYHWGTARAWNESGLTVLFSGAPGTGKTMAAEALSSALSLTMYRIDLSQVVNKYIGETEKNLKRIFDAAEVSDCLLFFDEADALFGKRTEVRDAHDRFANIEVSYLLERMERFKGLAILATNRRKDIDEAFVRRLRYIIEFPVPGVAERERIWRQVFPPQVDVAGLDFGFLARQFTLTGGYIRSIAFAACLQSAGARGPGGGGGAANRGGGVRGRARSVDMEIVLVAVKRELEKMNRAAGEAVFGPHRASVRERAQ